MTYFRIRRAHSEWLRQEIKKGTIFYQHHSFRTPEWVPCGEYRDDFSSYDSLSVGEVLMMISNNRKVYWRN